jgi:MFS transporter, ACS family, hexuronate transporter
MTRVRWTVCALLFFATTVSYVDRQVLSILAKTLETSVGWNSIQYGYITAAFQAAYAVGLLGVGRIIDRVGTRKAYAGAVGVWSLAAIAHAAATSAFTFGIARAALGLGEAANFPACIKTIAEWFPKKERALATGIFNSGANVGAVVAILSVPYLAATFGWRAAFIATGAIGFVWIILWWFLYTSPALHKRVSPAELALIQSDPPDKTLNVPWARLFPKRATWGFAVAKFLTDAVWWFFLFWFPKYLQETFHLTVKEIIWPTLVAYNICAIGSVGGGWLSGAFITRGWTVNASRKTAMLICALCVTPVIGAPYCKGLWEVVLLVGLALAAHQGFSANLYTVISDVFPRSAVGTAVGIGGAFGGLGGVFGQLATGFVVQLTGSYIPLFLVGGLLYLVALGALHLFTPRMEPEQV